MRVTPLEIRQKSFEKHFRGYDKDEVNGFLQTLSQEWERTLDENKELRIKLESTEREVSKLREVESSLYKTLKTAEDTGANVIEQARHAAELSMRESQFKAEAILNESKTKAKYIIEESDQRAKEILADMEDRFKILVDNYKKLEATRDDLISELKRLATDTLERVDKARASALDFDADQHLNQVRREAKKAIFPNLDFTSTYNTPKPISEPAREIPAPVVEEEVKTFVVEPEPVFAKEKEIVFERETIVVETPQPRKVQKSFFDEIG
ncbi:MAG TPA: DivIVA domain-containing protein [Cyclobacteriaceae bacterium]